MGILPMSHPQPTPLQAGLRNPPYIFQSLKNPDDKSSNPQNKIQRKGVGQMAKGSGLGFKYLPIIRFEVRVCKDDRVT